MDDFDVKCLPIDFVGTSRPSKVLQALYKRKEEAEEKILKEMSENQHKICQNYENLIESQSNYLKKELHDIRGLIKDELYEITSKSNQDNANSIDKHSFSRICKYIHQHTQKQHDLIETFYVTLQDVEKNKSKDLAGVLKSAYQTLKSTSLKPLEYWDKLFDLELEKVNQTILCNNRNYLELKTQLQAEAQASNKSAVQILQQIKENWVKTIRGQVKQAFDEQQKLYATNITEATKELLTEIENPEEWLNNIKYKLNNLDQQAQKYLLNYKQAALIIYNRFFQELHWIEQEMAQTETQQESPETYTMTLDDIVSSYDVGLKTIQEAWNSLVEQLTKTVDNISGFLIAAATLWQKHFKRTAALQAVILKDIQKTINANDRESQLHETKLNILIDTLRQEPSRDRLNKTLAEASKLLTLIEDIYKAQHQTEAAVFKKYKTAHELKVEVLMMEVKRFLDLYPPDREKDPKIQRKRASQTSEIGDPQENLIPAQMIYCKFQIDAVCNWQFGLWESISNYMTPAKAEIASETEVWVQNHMLHLDKRLEIRLGLHAMQFDKIQKQIYEERLEELCLHQSRIEEHKKAFESSLLALKNEYPTYTTKCENILNAFKEEMSHIETKAVYTDNSHGALTKKPIVEAESQKCLKAIEQAVAEYIGKYNTLFSHIKASHASFIQNIKFFSEEGNFSLQEVKDIIKNIEKIEAQAEKAIQETSTKMEAFKAFICDAVQTRTSDTQCALKSIAQEHKVNEIIKKNQHDLDREIKKEIDTFLLTLTTLAEQHEKSKAMIMVDFQLSFNDAKNMVEKLKEIADYLDEPTPIKIYSDKLALTKLSPRSKEDRAQELTMSLFNMDQLLPDANTLFLNLNKVLEKYWNDILIYMKKFYKEHSECFYLEEEMICYSFMKQMFCIYKAFHSIQYECEIKTMQETKKFLKFAYNYGTFLERYLYQYIDQFTTRVLEQYQQFYETEVKQVLHNEKIKVEEQYKQLHGKLKPLYGHPMNKKILEKLQIEAEIISSDAIELMGDIKAPLLEKIHKEYNKIVEEYNIVKDIEPEIIKLLQSLKETIEPLAQKLNEKINLLNMMEDHTSSFSLFGPESPPQTTRNSWFWEIQSNESTESSLAISFTPDPSLLTEEWMSTDSTSLVTSCSDVFSTSLKERHDRYCKELNKDNLEETTKKLKAQWDCAVYRVMELYCVKYR